MAGSSCHHDVVDLELRLRLFRQLAPGTLLTLVLPGHRPGGDEKRVRGFYGGLADAMRAQPKLKLRCLHCVNHRWVEYDVLILVESVVALEDVGRLTSSAA